jgi:uncharacterized protein YjbJ (UPF0337 family)
MANSDTLTGTAKDVLGQGKQAVGDATGDSSLKGSGVADQVSGQGQKAYGQLRDFAKKRPVLATTLAGVLGVALLNTLRGK